MAKSETFKEAIGMGYRELNDTERTLMAQIKEHSELTRTLVARIEGFLDEEATILIKESPQQTDDQKAAGAHLISEGQRWLSLARDDLQLGGMQLTRAVSRPTNF